MKKTFTYIVFAIIVFTFIHCNPDDNPPTDSDSLTDIDGNVYKTVKIGDQIWTIENLKVTTLNDGTPIEEWSFVNDWYNGNNPVLYYQWADTSDLNNLFDEELPFDYYGALYNEFALANDKLAPEGWRIPTEQDFKILETFLANNGHINDEASALKTVTGWAPTSSNGTDIYGFNGRPNGYASAFGTATGAQIICVWATSTINNAENTRRVVSLFDEPNILFSSNSNRLGAGVRLIKE